MKPKFEVGDVVRVGVYQTQQVFAPGTLLIVEQVSAPHEEYATTVISVISVEKPLRRFPMLLFELVEVEPAIAAIVKARACRNQ